MGLRDALQQAAKATFDALGDLKEAVTLRYQTAAQATQSGYDPATRATTRPQTTLAVQAVLAGFSRRDIEASINSVAGRDPSAIRADDLKCILAALDLGAVVPKTGDEVVRADGSVWTVITLRQDPAGATYTLQLRRP